MRNTCGNDRPKRDIDRLRALRFLGHIGVELWPTEPRWLLVSRLLITGLCGWRLKARILLAGLLPALRAILRCIILTRCALRPIFGGSIGARLLEFLLMLGELFAG